MVGVDSGVRIDLQGVYVIPGVLEEPIVRVEHLVTEQVEPLAGHAAVVQAVLAAELDHQALAQIFRTHFADLAIGVFKHLLSRWNKKSDCLLRIHPYFVS